MCLINVGLLLVFVMVMGFEKSLPVCLINVVMVMASVERCLHVVCDMILSSVYSMPKSQVFQWSECVLLLLGMKPLPSLDQGLFWYFLVLCKVVYNVVYPREFSSVEC